MKEFSLSELQEIMADKDSDYHLSFRKFNRKREWELHDTIIGKNVVFLDLKYLIIFRDLLSNNEQLNLTASDKQVYSDIYKLLKQLIDLKKIVCVISSSIIDEMDKIDEPRRKATAKVFDVIGQGIIFNTININLNELVNVDRIISGEPLIPRYHLSTVFESNPVYSQTVLKEFDSLPGIMKNISFAELCTSTLEEYVIGNYSKNENSGDIIAQIFNSAKAQNEEILQFKNLILRELNSIIKSYSDWKLAPLKNSIRAESHIELFKQYAPHMYLMAAIHSAMAMNRDQRYKSNDYYDLLHSCSAVGYADVFFTEKRFHHLLKTPPVNAEKLFKVKILSEPIAILNYLNSFS